MLQIASYHFYFLTKIYLHQNHFNMSFLCDINMCCLVRLRLHVDMRTLFKKIANKEIHVNAICENKKIFLHLTCGNNHCFLYYS
jgi:hypothetical protein